MGNLNHRDLFSFWVEALYSWSIISRTPLTKWDRIAYVLPGGQRQLVNQVGNLWALPNAQYLILEATMTPPLRHTHLVLDLDGEGLVRLNDHPIFGLNAFHWMFRIPSSWAEPKTLRVEVGRLGLMGQPFDHPEIRDLAWYQIDDTVYQTYWDLKVLNEYLENPSISQGISSDLIRDLQQAIHPIYTLPPDKQAWTRWLSRQNDWAEAGTLRRTLQDGNKIRGLIDIPRSLLNERIKETHKRLQEVIFRLKRDFPGKPGHIQALGHAHIDLAWLWREDETRRKIIRTAATQIHLLESFPDYIFGMSSPAMWKIIEEEEPALFAQVTELARQGRIEPLGAFWVEADSQMPDASSIIRQMIYTLRYFMDHLGIRPITAFLPDTFGFSAGLPSLLAQAGIRIFFTTKLNWNDTTIFPYKDFFWVGPDAKKVQVHIFGGVEQGYNGTFTLHDLMESWHLYQNFSSQSNPLLYTFGYGDGGGGPNQDMLERMERYNNLPGLPKITPGPASDLTQGWDAPLPRYRGELYLEYHRGTLTSQSLAKSQMRRMQEILRLSEALGTWLKTDENFRPLWERILTNQFHDILPGSAIRQVYEDFAQDMKVLQENISRTIAAALNTLFPVSTNNRASLVLLNPSGMLAPPHLVEFSAPYHPEVAIDNHWQLAQKVGHDHYVITAGPMEPLSLVSLAVRQAANPPLEATSEEEFTSYTCRTGTFCITFGPEGIRQMMGEGQSLLRDFAGIRAYWHHPDRYDAWELMPDYQDHLCDLRHKAIRVTEPGPLCQVITLQHQIENSVITETYCVDFVHSVINLTVRSHIPDRHVIVRYEIPTNLISSHAIAESIWGCTVHPTVPGSKAESAQFEWAAHRFVDLSEGGNIGLALLNNGRYGHSVDEGRIGVTLSTSPLYPDPAADSEPQDISLCLVPHKGTWQDARIMEKAHSFSAGTMTTWIRVNPHESRAFVKGWPANFRILAFKHSEDGSQDAIMQLGEMFGYRGKASCHINLPWQSVRQVDLITEDRMADLGTVHFDSATHLLTWHYHPYELLVLRWSNITQ